MISDALDFLGNETTGRALTLVGGAIAAFVLAAWAVFKHYKSKPSDQDTTKTVTLSLSEYKTWLLNQQVMLTESGPATSAQSEEIQKRLDDPEKARLLAQAEIQKLEDALSEHEKAGVDYFSEARAAFQQGDLITAEASLRRKQTEFEPVLKRASDLYLGLAVIAEQKADWLSAAKYYSQSAVLHETEENLIRAAIFLWRAGAIGEAFIISQKLLERYRSQYGPRDERVAGILNNLAAQLYEMGQVDEAKSTLLQALSIRDELSLPKDRDYAGALTNLGNVFLVEGDFREAERLHRQSIGILESLENVDVSTLLAVTNSLAEALRLAGDYVEAEQILENNYQATLAKFGSEHPDVARALNFLAKLQLDIGKKDAGVRNLVEALRLQRSALGDYHPNSIVIALGILHLFDTEPTLFENWDLVEIEKRYRPLFEQYSDSQE